MTENYSFTRKKIRGDRAELIRTRVITALCVVVPTALGSLVHEGWAVAGLILGLVVDAVYFRRR